MTNCIIAKFEQGSYHAKRVYGLTQWDVGRYLKVVGLSLPENAEIHFSLEDSIGRAERVKTLVKDGVAICKIPQYILENESAASDYSAYVWVYLRGSDSGETIGKTILHIRTRPKPSDYVYTEEEVLSYEKLKEELEAKIASGGGTVTKKSIENALGYVPSDFSGSYNDLEDKPFGEEKKQTEIINENLLYYGYDDEVVACDIFNEEIIDIIYRSVGRDVKISLDGEIYECRVKKEMDEKYNIEITYFGDGSLIEKLAPVLGSIGDAGEFPFCFIILSNANGNHLCNICYKSDVDLTIHTVIILDESELKQLDEKFIPDSVKKHDWNTLENRPFYDDIKWIEVDNGVYSSTTMAQINRVETLNPLPISEGKKVKVVWDGVEYQVEVKTISFFGTNILAFGNASVLNELIGESFEDTGEPFFYDISNDGYTCKEPVTDMRIITMFCEEELKQLDEKFIPSTIARTTDIPKKEEIVADVLARVIDGSEVSW